MKIAEDKQEKLRKFYETSRDYKKLLDAHNREYLKPYIDIVLKYARPGSKILDSGCGNGLSSYMLNEKGHWVVGTDISAFFLSEAAQLQSENLKYQACDVLALPFNDKSFDVVCSNELIEHVTNAGKTLTEMIRVLKNGGLLIIMGPNLCSPFWAVVDFINMTAGKNGRHVWAESRIQALKWGTKNLGLSMKKKLSSKSCFIYREPDLEKAIMGGDSDSVYYSCPTDIELFLKANDMEIISLCESTTSRGRFLARFFPRFSPYISMVARKL
ncbi:methyltransferase domain-containing protein [Candidatus Poribacteria bacterium]|nr:methyltransferase domain-containing protein [Candidatus Poribacteria bacterium]